MSQTFIITNAGRAALVNAANTGTLPVTFSHIGVTASNFTATAAMTALPGEIKRLTTFGGLQVADDTIHVTVNDAAAVTYSLRGFALYLSNGTLFGLYGQATPIGEKTPNSSLLMSADIKLADIAAASLTFGSTEFINPPATETVMGVLQLATNAEAQAGTNALKAITPKTLLFAFNAWVAAQFSNVWRSTNDGAGSGLDADLLDGQQGSWYTAIAARLGYTPANRAGDTFTGPVVVSSAGAALLGINSGVGNLSTAVFQSGGTTIWRLGKTASNTFYLTRYNDAGVHQGDVFTVYQASGEVNFHNGLTRGGNRVWDAGNDGAGSGADADLLDGLQGASYARSDADAQPAYRSRGVTLANPAIGNGGVWLVNTEGLYVQRNGAAQKIWDAGNDGAGSGLDADRLDGNDGSWYADIAGRLGFMPVRQGGGVGQLASNTIRMGWGTNGRLKVTVDITDLGNVVFDGHVSDVWRSSNDGAGSGMDADLLDGLQGHQYARNDGVGNPARSAGLLLTGATPGENFSSHPIQIREVGYVGAAQAGSDYAPGIAFHWSGRAAGHLKLYADGSLRARNNSTTPTAYIPFYAATIYSNGHPVWTAGNDGAGSGLDADRLDGNDGSWYADIAGRLGFVPIQQGGGEGQSNNKIRLGWSGSRLKAQVDTTDLGNVVFDSDLDDLFGDSNTSSSAGWCPMPGGFILQWKRVLVSRNGGTLTTAWPKVFTTLCCTAWASQTQNTSGSLERSGCAAFNWTAAGVSVNNNANFDSYITVYGIGK